MYLPTSYGAFTCTRSQLWCPLVFFSVSTANPSQFAQAGVEKLVNLRVLWMSNNKVKDWAELDRLAASAHLEDLLLLGNPLNPAPGSPEYRMEVKVTATESVSAKHYQCENLHTLSALRPVLGAGLSS